MKYYLLESVELLHSPKLKPPAQTSLEVPHHARPHRRPGTVPRKTPAHTVLSNTEAFGDGTFIPSLSLSLSLSLLLAMYLG